MNNLSILLNIILKMHFNTSRCIMHLSETLLTDNTINNQISLRDFPVYLQNGDDMENFTLDANKFCRDFIISCNSMSSALRSFERKVQTTSGGGYNQRKYIIVLNYDEFEEFFTSSALYFIKDLLVIVRENEGNGTNETHNSLEHFIDKKIASRDKIFKLYTHKFVGIENNNEPILLDIYYSCNKSFSGISRTKNVEYYGKFSGLFPNKVRNQQGRKLFAYLDNNLPYSNNYDKVGTEYNIFMEFIKWYNITYIERYNATDNVTGGDIAKNFTGTGLFGSLLWDEPEFATDLVCGGFPGGELADYIYDLIISSYFGLTVIVPIPIKSLGWYSVFKTFTFQLWLLYISAYISIFILIKMRTVHINEERNRNASTITAIYFFGLICNQPLLHTRYPQGIRTLLLISLVMLVLFVAIFNSRLLSTLVVPIYINDIDSVVDLYESGITIVASINLFDLLKGDTSPIYKSIYDHVYLTLDDNIIDVMFKELKHAFAINYYETGFIYSSVLNIFNHTYAQKYKVLDEMVIIWKTHFALRKNSIYTPELFEIIHRVREIGLNQIWEKQAFSLYDVSLKQLELHDEKDHADDGTQKLQLAHVKSPFGILFFGYGLAVITFIFEVYSRRMISMFN